MSGRPKSAPLLDRLYDHILGRLMSINLQDDPAICDEIVRLLTRMRDGWAEIAGGAVPPGSGRPSASVVFASPAVLSA